MNKSKVVICGMGCRFPGADGLEQFWSNLTNAVDSIKPVPADRWNIQEMYDGDYRTPGKIHQKEGGFVEGIREFDPHFFRISNREAYAVDPQQRLLLEAFVQTCENAGLPISELSGSRSGVFVGISTHDYSDIQQSPSDRDFISAYTNQGGSLAIAANRISYLFNLRGPSLALDTACSSSIYALNSAVSAMQNGDCDIAFVGGVNVMLKPEMTVGFSKGNFLSPTSRCRAFSAEADGYVRSEGAGMVMLCTEEKAKQLNLPILAEVLSIYLNEDGRTEGMSLPSTEAQKDLLRGALKKAGIHGRDIQYVECHGTGTAAGDPIECAAIGEVYGQDRTTECLIGSVKTNIGHLEAGSGIAGLIKMVLSMQHGQIPASLHSQNLNPKIPFGEQRLQVVQKLTEWKSHSQGRIGAINSFGFGGANAHAILVQREQVASSGTSLANSEARSGIALGSARSVDSLKSFFAKVQARGLSIHDVTYTSLRHRDSYDERTAFVSLDGKMPLQALESFKNDSQHPQLFSGTASPRAKKVAFIFSGQGPQWYRMGRDLLEKDPVFKAQILELDKLFLPKLGWSIWEALHRDEATAQMEETNIAQPTVFSLQIAIARRLQSAGIQPHAVLGHSLGEIAAGVISGSISLEEGVDIIYHRSRLHQTVSGKGNMLAASLTEKEALLYCDQYQNKISVGVVNADDAVVFSGDKEEIHALSKVLEEKGIFNRVLRGKVAFHSYHMDPFRDELLQCLGHLAPRESDIHFYSGYTGKKSSGTLCGASYWVDCVREPVRFAEGIQNLLREGVDTFIEISPHPVLSAAIETNIRKQGKNASVYPTLRREQNDILGLYGCIAKLYCAGHTLSPLYPGQRIDMPNYSFDKSVFWLESQSSERSRTAARKHASLEKTDSRYEVRYNHYHEKYLADHIVQGAIVVPGATHMDLLFSVAQDMSEASEGRLDIGFKDVEFQKAYFLPKEGEMPHGLVDVRDDDLSFTLKSFYQGQWVNHVTGSFLGEIDNVNPLTKSPPLPKFLKAVVKETHNIEQNYQELGKAGLLLGPTFQNLIEVKTGSNQGKYYSVSIVKKSEALQIRPDKHNVHGAMLDTCLQSTLFSVRSAFFGNPAVYIPVGVGVGRLCGRAQENLLCVTELIEITEQHFKGNLWIYNFEEDKSISEILDTNALENLKPICELFNFKGQYLEGSRVHFAARDLELSLSEVPRQRKGEEATFSSSINKDIGDLTSKRIENSYDDRKLHQHYVEVGEQALDTLALRFMVNAAIQICGSSTVTRQEFIDSCANKNLAAWVLQRLSEAGLLKEGSNLSIETAAETEDESHFKGFELERQLIEAVGESLLDILKGQRSGPEVLFSDTHSGVLKEFYRNSYANRFYNEKAAAVVSWILQFCPAGKPIRILEVGAGTGGLTSALTKLLSDVRVEYYFTDNSSSFLEEAQSEFGGPNKVFRVLDIEDPGSEWSQEIGSFDIVLGSNVVHATKRIGSTLNQIHKFLRPGGVSLLLEITEPPVWAHLIFGVTDGWWNFLEDSLPRTQASMSSDQWISVLKDTGFWQAFSIQRSEEEGAVSYRKTASQSLILAQKRRSDSLERKPVSIQETLLISNKELEPLLGMYFRAETHLGNRLIEKVDGLDPKELSSFKNIVFAQGLDESSIQDFDSLYKQIVEPVVHVASMAKTLSSRPSISILIRDGKSEERSSLILGSMTGVVRVLSNEYPGVSMKLVCLRSKSADEAESMWREVQCSEWDSVVYLDGEDRMVERWLPVKERGVHLISSSEKSDMNYSARRSLDGQLESLSIVESPRLQPQEFEIEIQTQACALNFRDLMLSMNMMAEGMIHSGYFGDNLGLECVGKVVAAGKGVTRFQVGDMVAAYCRNGLSRFVVTHEKLAAHVPAGVTAVDAATLPIAAGTAWMALFKNGGLKKGEKVLIQAAAGGVGQAAVQLSLNAGAKVYATAGSQAKHRHLLDMGVEEVYSSRDLRFQSDLLGTTNGYGVDVVLNSLSGPFLTAGINCLAPYGRFVEIGKTDIYENSRIGLYNFRKNSSLSVVDLDAAIAERTDEVSGTLTQIFELLKEGRVSPLPHKVFALEDLKGALRFLSRSEQIGKVVIDMTKDLQVQRSEKLVKAFSADGVYVMTGGTGGIGGALTRWLADNGAKKIVSLSPSGDSKESVKDLVRNLAEQKVQFIPMKCDISDKRDVEKAFVEIKKEYGKVAGFIHGAMVLDDCSAEELNLDRFSSVVNPKAMGAVYCHEELKDVDLDFFLMFSSVSSAYGNVRQTNYNAANSLLENLAHVRRNRGLPATTLQLGVVGGQGFVARNKNVASALDRLGWQLVPVYDLIGGIEKALQDKPVVRSLVSAQWNVVEKNTPSPATRSRLSFLSRNDGGDHLESDKNSLMGSLSKMRTSEEKASYLKSQLGQELQKLVASSSGLAYDKSIRDFGIDSLMATQLRSWIQTRMSVDIPIMQLMSGPTLTQLAEKILESTQGQGASAETSASERFVLQHFRTPDAKKRVFCFPYMGGVSSAIYGSWKSQLGSDYDLCIVALPGSLDRRNEACVNDFNTLIDQIQMALDPLLNVDFVVYGHSQGALIASEWLKRIDRDQRISPVCFVAGAYQAPHLPRPFLDVKNIPEILEGDLPDILEQQIYKFGMSDQLIVNKDVRDALWPSLRSGFLLAASHTPEAGSKMSCPIVAVAGTEDRVFSVSQVEEWQAHTRADFSLETVKGPHLFLESDGEQVLSLIRSKLG